MERVIKPGWVTEPRMMTEEQQQEHDRKMKAMLTGMYEAQAPARPPSGKTVDQENQEFREQKLKADQAKRKKEKAWRLTRPWESCQIPRGARYVTDPLVRLFTSAKQICGARQLPEQELAWIEQACRALRRNIRQRRKKIAQSTRSAAA